MEPYLFRNMLVDLARELKGADLNDVSANDLEPLHLRTITFADERDPMESIDDVDSKVKSV